MMGRHSDRAPDFRRRKKNNRGTDVLVRVLRALEDVFNPVFEVRVVEHANDFFHGLNLFEAIKSSLIIEPGAEALVGFGSA